MTFVNFWEGISQDNRTITLSLRLAGILRRLLVSGTSFCINDPPKLWPKNYGKFRFGDPQFDYKGYIHEFDTLKLYCFKKKQLDSDSKTENKTDCPTLFHRFSKDLFLKNFSNVTHQFHRAVGQECLELWGLTCGGWGGCFLLGTDGILVLMGMT